MAQQQILRRLRLLRMTAPASRVTLARLGHHRPLGHSLAFLLKAGLGVLRVTIKSSSMSLLTSQEEATENVRAMCRIGAAGKRLR